MTAARSGPALPAPQRVEPEATIPADAEHRCRVCGAPGCFGFGVRLLADKPGRWACETHRDQVERMAP